jgi:hypothetical protein
MASGFLGRIALISHRIFSDIANCNTIKKDPNNVSTTSEDYRRMPLRKRQICNHLSERHLLAS